jgi:hypothetical protein
MYENNKVDGDIANFACIDIINTYILKGLFSQGYVPKSHSFGGPLHLEIKPLFFHREITSPCTVSVKENHLSPLV